MLVVKKLRSLISHGSCEVSVKREPLHDKAVDRCLAINNTRQDKANANTPTRLKILILPG